MNELITRAKEGDKEAADKLIRDSSDELYLYCMRLCCNEHDAKDLMQETYLTAFSKINQYRYDESFRAWLHTIAVHKFYNRIRDEKKYNFCDIGDVSEHEEEIYVPEECAVKKELSDTVKEIIDTSLSDSQRLAVIMYYYDELPVNMIAEKLDCSEGTVKSRLYYSRKILRSELIKRGITLGGTAAVLSSVLRSASKDVSAAVIPVSDSAFKLRIAAGVTAFAMAGGTAVMLLKNIEHKEETELVYRPYEESWTDSDFSTDKQYTDSEKSTAYSELYSETVSDEIFNVAENVAEDTVSVNIIDESGENAELNTITENTQTFFTDVSYTESTTEYSETVITSDVTDLQTEINTESYTSISDLEATESLITGEFTVRNFDSSTMTVSIPDNYTVKRYYRYGNDRNGYGFSEDTMHESQEDVLKYLLTSPNTYYSFRPDDTGDEIIFSSLSETPDEADISEAVSRVFPDAVLIDSEKVVIKNDSTNSKGNSAEKPGELFRFEESDYKSVEVLMFRGNIKSTHVIFFCDSTGRRMSEYQEIRDSIVLSYLDSSWKPNSLNQAY